MRFKKLAAVGAIAAATLVAPATAAMAGTATHAGTTAVQKPAYSNLYNYYLRSDIVINTYASSYWLYSGTRATAWNLAYVGTVKGGTGQWPYSNGGINDNQAGLAAYRIFDAASGNCWGLNGQTIEETNACSTANTLWVATPAPNGVSGHFGLENVGNTNLKDSYMMAETWAENAKMSVNYRGAGNNGTANGQSFELVAP